MGGLWLDSGEAVRKGGKSGPPIVPGTGMGTARYRVPEQVLGENTNETTGVYSLAAWCWVGASPGERNVTT
jgi:hypothetical protein